MEKGDVDDVDDVVCSGYCCCRGRWMKVVRIEVERNQGWVKGRKRKRDESETTSVRQVSVPLSFPFVNFRRGTETCDDAAQAINLEASAIRFRTINQTPPIFRGAQCDVVYSSLNARSTDKTLVSYSSSVSVNLSSCLGFK